MPDQMTNKKRFLIAGCGALAPLIVNLAAIDLQSLATFGLTTVVIVSYALRQLVLFSIGGFFGYINQESSPLKLFQIGIAAPALLTALINANQVAVPQVPAPGTTTSSSPVSLWENWIVVAAFANDVAPDQTKVFSLPAESTAQQFSRGLLGLTPSNVYYVIVGSFLTKEAAAQFASEVRAKKFHADVYQPYGTNSTFSVVIGAQMSLGEAQKLRSKAIAAGLPSAHVWTFPTI